MSVAAPAAPTESPPLAIWIGFIAMVVGQFMAILDIQIVASAIGSIQAGVSASRDEISWVQTAYLIAEVIGIPLSGFLGRALGTRLLFCLSALLFSLSSLLCAFSWDISSLIVFRAMQGFSGAAMIPTVMATLYLVFPLRLQPMTGAMMGMVITLAPSLGPTIGGYVAEVLGWRALFWVNVAPGVLITLIIWNTMGSLGKADFSLLKKIDLLGLLGLAFFLGGDKSHVEQAMPVLKALGDTFVHLGPLSHGHTAKLISNVLSYGTVALVNEAFMLGSRAGVDLKLLFDALMQGATSKALEAFGPRIVSGEYQPPRVTVETGALRFASQDDIGST